MALEVSPLASSKHHTSMYQIKVVLIHALGKTERFKKVFQSYREALRSDFEDTKKRPYKLTAVLRSTPSVTLKVPLKWHPGSEQNINFCSLPEVLSEKLLKTVFRTELRHYEVTT